MNEKKGYGLIIPADFEVAKWEKETAQNILDQLKRLTKDAFYRMAEEVGINLELLTESGYEFDSLSTIAVKELESCISDDKFKEVTQYISKRDYTKDEDFRYVLRLYDDKTNAINMTYSVEMSDEIKQSIKYVLIAVRERILKLIALFIDEFEDGKTESRRRVLKEYGGHFISKPELDSFLSYRDDLEWYRGDTFDPEYKEEVDQMRVMRDLIPLYKLISEGGEFQIQSTRQKHHKIIINKESTAILADAIALALKMLHDTNPMLNPGTDIDKSYTWVDLICSREGSDVDRILESLEYSIGSYDSEFDLDLFYYLADNAIDWPKDITLTQRCLFLYKLAKFFNFVPATEYDSNTYISTRKEIVEAIKYKIRQMKNRDKDGKMLDSHYQ
ncbi:MAG: hypothetical protein K2N05_09100 [Muribaculaceae bacterium]|nr:hypothetical protein [Muribaculaceae bacterium]